MLPERGRLNVLFLMLPTVSSVLIIDLITRKCVFLAAAVMKSAEGGSVGRRVLSSRHNESTIKDEIVRFSTEHNLQWSIKLHSNTLYVKIPEELSEGSKEK